MKDKVAAKRNRQKTRRELTDSGGSGGTNRIPPKTPKNNGDSSGSENPDLRPQKPKRDLWSFFAEILSPIIIAVMTIVITGVTYYQWDATDGQLTEMKKATEQVDKSLDFLKTQTDLAKNSLISSQRAWIAPMSVSVDTPYAHGEVWKFSVNYQNTGREPAINARWHARLLSVIGSPLKPPLAMGRSNMGSCFEANKSSSRTFIYPSDTTTYKLYYDRIMDVPIGRILKGDEIAYLEGCIMYETYGLIKQSRFCFYWVNEEGKNPKEWAWRFCPSGNEGN